MPSFSPAPGSTSGAARHRRPLLRVGLALLAASASLAGSPGSASALTGNGSTTANVSVNNVLSLTSLTSAFTLTGDPSATVTSNSAVSMKVTTNNAAGYSVTVQAAADQLSGTGSNTETIPLSALKVKGSGSGSTYGALSSTTPVQVHTQSTKSDADGDTITNGYQIAIPFVNADTYSVTLNYVATTL